MNAKAKRAEDKSELLVSVARQIIRETGDFDLPMRLLASRAQVSLRTPYELFGSKNGVIRAILKLDQAYFRVQAHNLTSADPLDNIFDRVRLGVDLYAANQPFYRALFRATQAYSGGEETEPARENLKSFRILSERVKAVGMVRPEVDTDLLAEIITDIFAASFRTWASSTFDISLAGDRIGFGIAMVFASAAPEPHATRMRGRAADYQAAVQAFAEPNPTADTGRDSAESA